jgi:hypothetical protein
MIRTFFLSTSTRPEKKYMIYDYDNPDKVIHFGAKGYQSYPDHKNLLRKKAYILRHKARENWGKSGMDTSGFFSRWLLWNKPSLADSIKDTEDRFDIKIIT